MRVYLVLIFGVFIWCEKGLDARRSSQDVITSDFATRIQKNSADTKAQTTHSLISAQLNKNNNKDDGNEEMVSPIPHPPINEKTSYQRRQMQLQENRPQVNPSAGVFANQERLIAKRLKIATYRRSEPLWRNRPTKAMRNRATTEMVPTIVEPMRATQNSSANINDKILDNETGSSSQETDDEDTENLDDWLLTTTDQPTDENEEGLSATDRYDYKDEMSDENTEWPPSSNTHTIKNEVEDDQNNDNYSDSSTLIIEDNNEDASNQDASVLSDDNMSQNMGNDSGVSSICKTSKHRGKKKSCKINNKDRNHQEDHQERPVDQHQSYHHSNQNKNQKHGNRYEMANLDFTNKRPSENDDPYENDFHLSNEQVSQDQPELETDNNNKDESSQHLDNKVPEASDGEDTIHRYQENDELGSHHIQADNDDSIHRPYIGEISQTNAPQIVLQEIPNFASLTSDSSFRPINDGTDVQQQQQLANHPSNAQHVDDEADNYQLNSGENVHNPQHTSDLLGGGDDNNNNNENGLNYDGASTEPTEYPYENNEPSYHSTETPDNYNNDGNFQDNQYSPDENYQIDAETEGYYQSEETEAYPSTDVSYNENEVETDTEAYQSWEDQANHDPDYQNNHEDEDYNASQYGDNRPLSGETTDHTDNENYTSGEIENNNTSLNADDGNTENYPSNGQIDEIETDPSYYPSEEQPDDYDEENYYGYYPSYTSDNYYASGEQHSPQNYYPNWASYPVIAHQSPNYPHDRDPPNGGGSSGISNNQISQQHSKPSPSHQSSFTKPQPSNNHEKPQPEEIDPDVAPSSQEVAAPLQEIPQTPAVNHHLKPSSAPYRPFIHPPAPRPPYRPPPYDYEEEYDDYYEEEDDAASSQAEYYPSYPPASEEDPSLPSYYGSSYDSGYGGYGSSSPSGYAYPSEYEERTVGKSKRRLRSKLRKRRRRSGRYLINNKLLNSEVS